MKKVFTFLLAAVLLIGAAPATQAQKGSKLVPKTLSLKEANQLLQRIVGNWQVNHYVNHQNFENEEIIETKGTVNFSRAFQGDYVHEKYELKQPDSSTLQGDGFLRYSEERGQFELVQMDKKGRSIVLMAGQWYPEYNTLLFRPAKGEGQWSPKCDPYLQCLYIFKEDGSFIRLHRTLDQYGNYVVVSQDHYTYSNVAKL